MNHESYVSLETAKMLKKAGFNWTVRSFYQEPLPGTSLADMFKHDPESKYERHDMPISHTDWNNHRDTQFKEDRIYYSAPTLAVAQRWLREEKLWHITLDYNISSGSRSWYWQVTNGAKTFQSVFSTFSYEDMQEAAIKTCLEELLKES